MFDEIEKFIKKIAEAAEAAQRQEQRQREPQPQPPQNQNRPPQKQRGGKQQRPPRIAPPVEEVVDADIIDVDVIESADRFSKKVARDFRGSEQISKHASQIGRQLEQSDENMDAHVHQALDHKLGTLKQSDTKAPQAQIDATTDVVLNLKKSLSSPDSLRNAIIVSELLRRPEENW